jgi:lipopolysaccharide export system permease protein
VTKLDRYILAQLLGPFAFFCFIISGILWLNQALGIVRIVTENGQPASIFVELSVLLLPKVLIAAIPIAGFAAAVFLTNRLYGEAELVVMMSAGQSYQALAKPFLIFGAVCFTTLFIVVHFLGPFAHSKLLQKQDEIKREFITQIIQPGAFISSQDKFTFFFGQKGRNGELKDILIEEQVNDGLSVTHIANEGQVIREAGKTTLVLQSGSIQRHNRFTGDFSLVQFDSLAFDLTQLGGEIEPRALSATELTSPRLYLKLSQITADDPSLGRTTALFHDRNVKTLLALLFPVLGMVALLVGGYRRSGFTTRIIAGILMMAGLDSFRGATKTWVTEDPHIWYLHYLSVLTCVGLIALLLSLASRDTRRLNPFGRKGVI